VGNGQFEAFAYVSFNHGKTWTASQPYINRNASRLNAADPTVAFGPDGAVYFAFVALTPAQGAVAVSRSTDGGLTWSSQTWATSFAGTADKPAIAAANGNLYLFYQSGSLYSQVSTDRGATWSSPTLIEAGGRNAYPVVDRKGHVYVFYNTATSIKLAYLNGDSAFSVYNVSSAAPLQPRAALYRASVYPAGGVDKYGNLYVAWADGRNAGQGNDILYSRSTDSGSTWSAPAVLNTDGTAAD
jgi:Neuraminidase (sialidase)